MKNKLVEIISFNLCFAILLASFTIPVTPQTTKQPVVQGMETIDAPIEATVKPSLTIVGLGVKIGGKTENDGKRFDVKITVTPPQGAPVSLTAKIDDAGKFEIPFALTNSTGRYVVKIVAPDGKGTTSASFEALSPDAAFARPADTAAELLEATDDTADASKELIDSLPPSPPKEELKAKIDELKENLAKSSDVVGKFRQSLARLAQIPERNPEMTEAFEDIIEKLDTKTSEAKSQTVSLRQQIAKSRKDGVRCDKLDTANEAFNAISFALNLNSKLFDLIKNFAIDKGTPRLLAAAAERSGTTPNAATNLFLSDTLKFSVSVLTGGVPSPVGWAMNGIGIINDIAQLQTAKVFDQYCERFEGPVDGTFGIKFLNNLELFWSYNMTLKGKLSLRYAKQSQPNEAVHFTGQLEGNATNIDIKENFISINPNLKPFLIARRAYSPPTVPYVEDFGAFARMATPGYFRIPVEGEMNDGKLMLKWLPATNDFSKAFAGKALYIFVIQVPLITIVDLPMQNASFIFSRAMGNIPTFDVIADAAKTSQTITRAFTRNYDDPKGEFVIAMKINVKACNPGCLNNKIIER
jgi:hypothetical protein